MIVHRQELASFQPNASFYLLCVVVSNICFAFSLNTGVHVISLSFPRFWGKS